LHRVAGALHAMVNHLKKVASNSTKVRSLEAQLEDAILSKDKMTKDLTLELEQGQGQAKSLESELGWVRAKLEELEKRQEELRVAHENVCKIYEERLKAVESKYQERIGALEDQLDTSKAQCSSLSGQNEELKKGESVMKEQIGKLANMGMRAYSEGFKKIASSYLLSTLLRSFTICVKERC